MKTYGKTLRRMFNANLIRLAAIGMIIAIGIGVATGIATLPLQIRDSLASASFGPEQTALVNEVADKVELLGFIFPVFFIAVSALTALTTMTRLVEEERPVAACLKTLGYSDASIIFRHIIFAAVCSAAGCLLGLIAGNFLLRPIIFNAIKTKFDLLDTDKIFYVREGLMWSVAMGAATILTAFYVSWQKCRERPSALLRPKSPKAGKKIFLEYLPFIWKRLKFKLKSSVRNIWRDKSRLIMTVLSVAGSTIIVFCGLGLFSSLNGMEEGVHDITAFIDSMKIISIAVIFCAVALTVLVLFNLTNINIEERKREIATLKVLGYSQFEVSYYIYREVMILSVLGIILGVPAGWFFLGFMFDYLDFGSLDFVEWYVWILSAVVILLAVITTDGLLYRKIYKIEMCSSLKTVE